MQWSSKRDDYLVFAIIEQQWNCFKTFITEFVKESVTNPG